MSHRIARAQRLLAVETKRVASAEQALAASRRQREQCHAVVQGAEAALALACTRWLDVVSVDELAHASAHRSTLLARITAARVVLVKAEADVKVHEAAVVAARTGERRMEILIEGFQRTEAARAGKAERRLADEHASRMAGQTR